MPKGRGSVILIILPLLLTGMGPSIDKPAILDQVENSAENLDRAATNASLTQIQNGEKQSCRTANLVFTRDKRAEGKLVNEPQESPASILTVKQDRDMSAFKVNDSSWQATSNTEVQRKRMNFFPYQLIVDLFEKYQDAGEWSRSPGRIHCHYQGESRPLDLMLNDLVENKYQGSIQHDLSFTINPRTGYLTAFSWQAKSPDQDLVTRLDVNFSGFNTIELSDSFGQVKPGKSGK